MGLVSHGEETCATLLVAAAAWAVYRYPADATDEQTDRQTDKQTYGQGLNNVQNILLLLLLLLLLGEY